MANTQETYDAIKNLENNNVLSLPRDSVTVLAGTFDAETGGFQFAVPTMLVTEPTNPDESDIHPIEPGTPHAPHQPVQYWAGVVTANAADLRLEFQRANADPQSSFRFRVGLFPWTTIPAGQTSATVDVGGWTSTLTNGQPDTLTVSWPTATHTAMIHLVVMRPPTFGAFTIPVLPISLVYAPPPGPQNLNYAEYSSTSATSTKITTSTGSGSSSKTATAYTTNDFIGKITGLVDDISTFGTGLSDNQSSATILDIKSWTAGLDLASQILQAFIPDETSSDSSAITTSSEHDIVTTDTEMFTFPTPAGLGPGSGDCFVCLRNVRVAWLISKGILDITILGDAGIEPINVQQLLDDAAVMGPTVLGGVMEPEAAPFHGTAAFVSPFPKVGPKTNLDAGSIRMLVWLDPFARNQSPPLDEPRFTPNDQPTIGVIGNLPEGESLSLSHEVTTTDINTSTTVDLHISDYKPGWLVGLFSGNQATEDQLSSTYSWAKSKSIDEKVTTSVHLYAATTDQPYVIGVYFDRLFRTLAFTALSHDQLRTGKPNHPIREF